MPHGRWADERRGGPRRSRWTRIWRRSFREGGKVRNETVANLSHLPDAAITAVRSVLAGRDLVDAASVVSINRSVPHGHVAAVWVIAQQLGLPALLGPAGRMRDLALALINFPGGRVGVETGHPDRLGRRHPRRGPGRHRRVHRPGVRRDGLPAGPPDPIEKSAATPGTARKASRRSNTRCSPTRPAARSRSPPRSPR